MKGRVLIVAGSDSGGGAGIQADIKAVSALDGFAMTAITALTAQNTMGVHGIFGIPPEFIADQMKVVLEDLGADCIKIGMLHSPDVINTVCDVIEELAPGVPVVVDPVMVAKGGASLLQQEAVATMKARMIPKATVLTPNLPEAGALAGFDVETEDDARRAAIELAKMGPKAVLMKGGHMKGDRLVDLLFEGENLVASFEGERIDTPHTHGTGCTTASAIAAGLAQGLALQDAVARARRYVFEAIRTAPGYGGGHGPLNHSHTVTAFR